ETNRLRSLPEEAASELAQVLAAFDDRREVVAGERPRLAREADVPVREQDLGLADAARIEDELTRVRVARCVLRADADVEVAEGDPAALSAPADVDALRLERKQPPERSDG